MKSLTESILDNPEDVMNGAETGAVKAIADLFRTMKQIGSTAAEERTRKQDMDVFGNKLNVGDIFIDFSHSMYPVVGYYIYGIKRKRLVAKRFVYDKGRIFEDEIETYIDGIHGKIKWPIKVK
jgi:hypothetical protein